jgi:hypothetical protein
MGLGQFEFINVSLVGGNFALEFVDFEEHVLVIFPQFFVLDVFVAVLLL